MPSRMSLMAVALVAIAGLLASPLKAADPTVTVDVQIAPATLLLGVVQSAVTVHTDIPFATVVTGSVTLSGLPATATFADSCGNLVAKFDETAVKAIVRPPSAVLALKGTTRAGSPFEGSATVAVRRWPKK